MFVLSILSSTYVDNSQCFKKFDLLGLFFTCRLLRMCIFMKPCNFLPYIYTYVNLYL